MKAGTLLVLFLLMCAAVAMMALGTMRDPGEAYAAGAELRRTLIGDPAQPVIEWDAVDPAPQPAANVTWTSTPVAAPQITIQPASVDDDWWANKREETGGFYDGMAAEADASRVQWVPIPTPARTSSWPADEPVAAPARITHTTGMPHDTAVQVAPDRVWDYSTGQYHWADQQADGTLRQRQE